MSLKMYNQIRQEQPINEDCAKIQLKIEEFETNLRVLRKNFYANRLEARKSLENMLPSINKNLNLLKHWAETPDNAVFCNPLLVRLYLLRAEIINLVCYEDNDQLRKYYEIPDNLFKDLTNLPLEDCCAAIALDPKNQNAHLLRAEIYQKKSNDLLEDTDIKTAMMLGPLTAKIHYQLGVRYDYLNLKEAIFHFESAIKLKPDSAKIHRHLGSVYQRNNDFSKAIIHLETAIKLDPYHFGTYEDWVKAVAPTRYKLEDDGRVSDNSPPSNLSQIITDLEKEIEENPAHVANYCKLSSIYLRLENTEKVINYLNKAVAFGINRLEIDFAPLYYNYAQQLRKEGQLDKALENINLALNNLAQKDYNHSPDEFVIEAIKICIKKGDSRKALDYYQKHSDKCTDRILNFLGGVINLEQKNYAEAIKLLTQFIKSVSFQSDTDKILHYYQQAFYYSAQAFCAIGNYEDAMKNLDWCISFTVEKYYPVKKQLQQHQEAVEIQNAIPSLGELCCSKLPNSAIERIENSVFDRIGDDPIYSKLRRKYFEVFIKPLPLLSTVDLKKVTKNVKHNFQQLCLAYRLQIKINKKLDKEDFILIEQFYELNPELTLKELVTKSIIENQSKFLELWDDEFLDESKLLSLKDFLNKMGVSEKLCQMAIKKQTTGQITRFYSDCENTFTIFSKINNKLTEQQLPSVQSEKQLQNSNEKRLG